MVRQHLGAIHQGEPVATLLTARDERVGEGIRPTADVDDRDGSSLAEPEAWPRCRRGSIPPQPRVRRREIRSARGG